MEHFYQKRLLQGNGTHPSQQAVHTLDWSGQRKNHHPRKIACGYLAFTRFALVQEQFGSVALLCAQPTITGIWYAGKCSQGGCHRFYAENISFVNDFGVDAQTGPQALAIRLNNDRAAFYNCMFRSFQDTWMTSTNDADRLYAKNCFIEGAVDYFYGGGDALLDECTFYNVRSNSVIVAPKQSTAKYGYVFRNCIVDGNSAAADGKQKLGRPWHNAPKAIFINTTMRIPIDPEGWDDMGSVPALFAEYESRDINGNLLDLVNRKTFYEGRDGVSGTSRTTITKEEADQMVYENIIAGADGWNPRRLIK